MTKIEWTNEVWNPVTGCTRVSAGCDNCYAVAMTKRLATMPQSKAKYRGLVGAGKGHFNGVVRCHEDVLDVPFKWQRAADRFFKRHGRRRRVFVNSMSDLYHKGVPFDFIDKVKAVEALCPDLDFLELTKRPERMAQYLNGMFRQGEIDDAKIDIIGTMADRGSSVDAYVGEEGSGYFEHGYLENVWLGTSIEDQATADERIPHLLKCPAAVRFLSYEPALGPVTLSLGELMGDNEDSDVGHKPGGGENGMPWHQHWLHEPCQRVDWVICGGESGPGARPMDPDWARSIRNQCVAAGVPFFFKQWGGVNKKRAGRLLNGRTWDEMPERITA